MTEGIKPVGSNAFQAPTVRRVQLESQLSKAIARARLRYMENEPVQIDKPQVSDSHLGRKIDIYG